MKPYCRSVDTINTSRQRTRVEAMYITTLLLLAELVTTPALAASFDCNIAKAPAEKFVCANPTISKLDDELDALYRKTLTKASDDEKKQLIAQQRHWLSHTRNACRKEVCFKHAYWMRQAELAFFFEPKSPLYAREADQAEAIKKVLATATLYPHGLSDPSLCWQMLADLKEMKDIHFVDPVVQTMSYEDPALDSWKDRFSAKNGLGTPFTFEYPCWSYPTFNGDDVDTHLEGCDANYGLPPYKIFELPPLTPSGKTRYFFYSDDKYGPANNEEPPPLLHKAATFSELPERSASRSPYVVDDWYYGQHYDTIIEYQKRYFILVLKPYTGGAGYGLDITFTDANASCSWHPVKD